MCHLESHFKAKLLSFTCDEKILKLLPHLPGDVQPLKILSALWCSRTLLTFAGRWILSPFKAFINAHSRMTTKLIQLFQTVSSDFHYHVAHYLAPNPRQL